MTSGELRGDDDDNDDARLQADVLCARTLCAVGPLPRMRVCMHARDDSARMSIAQAATFGLVRVLDGVGRSALDRAAQALRAGLSAALLEQGDISLGELELLQLQAFVDALLAERAGGEAEHEDDGN